MLDEESSNQPLPPPPAWFERELERIGGFKTGLPVLRVVRGNDPTLTVWRLGKLRPKYPTRIETRLVPVAVRFEGQTLSLSDAIARGIADEALNVKRKGALVLYEEEELYALLPRYVIETLVFESETNWNAARYARTESGELIDVLGPYPTGGALYMPLLIVEHITHRNGRVGTAFRELGEDVLEELKRILRIAETKGGEALVKDMLEEQRRAREKAEEEAKQYIKREAERVLRRPVSTS